MKSVEQHLADVLSVVEPLAPIELQLIDAVGCLVADDVRAPVDLPRFDNSAMDGYAVRLEDVTGASEQNPVRLPVVGDIAAGSTGPYQVRPGFCVRIMTGAPVPPGADAVIPVEWTDGGIAAVEIRREPTPNLNIRRAGEDVHAGDPILPAGTVLRAPQVGLLAAAGLERVLVRPRPRVVVISTGSELVEPGDPVGPGHITESNSYMLTAAAADAGAIAYRVGIVPDEPAQLGQVIDDQLIRADLVITTGGVSVGAYDVVKEVLERVGTVRFEQVAMQPGKPQGFGTVGPDSTPILTFPGNPVSAYVSFEVFGRPVIRRLLGLEPLDRPTVWARAVERLPSPPGRQSYLRAALFVEDGEYRVRLAGGQGSHQLAGLAQANALAIVPVEVTEVPAGEPVEVVVLERRMR